MLAKDAVKEQTEQRNKMYRAGFAHGSQHTIARLRRMLLEKEDDMVEMIVNDYFKGIGNE